MLLRFPTHLGTIPTQSFPKQLLWLMVPFGPLQKPRPLACTVATKATELVTVLPSILIGPSIPSLSSGPTTSSSHSKVDTSASFSMQGALVPWHLQTVMATTLA